MCPSPQTPKKGMWSRNGVNVKKKKWFESGKGEGAAGTLKRKNLTSSQVA